MANSSFIVYGLLLSLLIAITAFADSDVCSLVTCGKGKCQTKPDYMPHGYVCECDAGWKRTRLSDSEEQYLQFLPCIVPNCSINYSCMPAPAPLPPIPTNPENVTAFDPCYWVYCGEGTCMKSSDKLHKCQCQSGAYNLFNISQYPCYSECAFGSDCSKLGIKVSSKASLTTSSSDSNSTIITSSNSSSEGGKATSGIFSWKFNWMILATISLAIVS